MVTVTKPGGWAVLNGEDPRVWVPAYLGAYGWLGLDLDGVDDWDEVAELLDASYRQTAPKRSIARLDEQH